MKRWLLRTLILLVLLAAGYYVWTAYLRRPALSAEQVESVQITSRDQLGKKTQEMITKDRSKVTALIKVLNRGKPTSDHKCGDSGSIKLLLRDGSQLELGLLAGHHEPYYEFRLYNNDWRRYEMYRVERPVLLAALADLGITKVDLGGPE